MPYLIILGVVVVGVFSVFFLGLTIKAKSCLRKENEQANDQLKKEAERKRTVARLKEEIFEDAEQEKKKIGSGDPAGRFMAADKLLRKQ